MSRYKWIENKALKQIVDSVYADTHMHKDSDKRPEVQDLQIKTNKELLIIFDALVNLSKYVKGKREPGSRVKDPKIDMLELIEKLGVSLIEYNLVDEYLDHLAPIRVKVNQLKITTAKQYSMSIAKGVGNSLRDAGTSNQRIVQIKRFISDAVIAVAKNPNHYKNDIKELSKAFPDATDTTGDIKNLEGVAMK